jgi:spermidine synthase
MSESSVEPPAGASPDPPGPERRGARPGEIYAILFVAGAGTLALELLASRYMTPAFGSSLYIWGAILSVTLLCLAAGYRWGGRLADGLDAPFERLVHMILLAAVWIGVVPVPGRAVLAAGADLGAVSGPLLVMVVLFALPITLLATATPLAFGALVRQAPERPGRALGDLFAISTAGSVAGALLTAYVMVPVAGIGRSFVVTAVLLLLVVMPALVGGVARRRAIVLVGALGLLAYLPANQGPGAHGLREGVVFVDRRASPYAQLDVLDDMRDGTRVLLLDGASQNWVTGAGWSKSVFNYVPAMLRNVGRYPKDAAGRALVLGMGAGTLVRSLDLLDYQVEVVELDPAVVEVATVFFDFPSDRFDVRIGDARAFVERAAGTDARAYSLLVLDVAGGGNQPAHLFTREAFRAMREVMTPPGVLVVTLIVRLDPPHERLAAHTIATIAREFPHVEAYDVEPSLEAGDVTNVLVLASGAPPASPPAAFATDVALPIDASLRPFTDDWCPIDLWSIGINERWHRNVREWVGMGALLPG